MSCTAVGNYTCLWLKHKEDLSVANSTVVECHIL